MNDSINIDSITNLRAKRSKLRRIEIFISVYEHHCDFIFSLLFIFLFLFFCFASLFTYFPYASNENRRNENLFSSGESEKRRKVGKQQVLVEKQQQEKKLLKVRNIRFFYSHGILVWLWLGERDRWVLWKIIIISEEICSDSSSSNHISECCMCTSHTCELLIIINDGYLMEKLKLRKVPNYRY